MEHTLNQPLVYIVADTLISSLGFGTEENLEAIRHYQSGITLQEDGSIATAPLLAAIIDPKKLQQQAEQKGVDNYPRLEQLFILAIDQILAQSGINLKDKKCGLLLSTTKGNIDLLSRCSVRKEATEQLTELDKRLFLGEMAKRIGAHFEVAHPTEVISNACISGVSALIVAKRWIETGVYDQVIVAGGDILSHFITSGFLSFKSISSNRCLPYDVHRDGLNLGEACGAVLLSSKGTANDIVLSGGAISNDANHISGPSRTGDGLHLAIHQAMNEAGITPQEVSFVNTHGTATVYNDEMESKAIHLSGLQETPVQSLKPYFGHTLGASGIIESIICLHELKEEILFGTLSYKEPGVSMPIMIAASHRFIKMKSCVKTASGFGGCNAAIVLTRADSETTIRPSRCTAHLTPMPFRTSTTVSITKGQLLLNEMEVATFSKSDFAGFIRQTYKKLGESNMKFYKMDDLCKLGYVAATYLLKGETDQVPKRFEPQEMGLILANAASSLDTDIRHQVIIDKNGDEAASPTTFVYTLPNVVAGEICIRHQIQGENTFFIQEEYQAEKLEGYAHTVMVKGSLKACIVGWCELLGEEYHAEFKLIERINKQ